MMLFTVRLRYSLVVDASSSDAAFKKAVEKIKADPASMIAQVDQGAAGKKKSRSLLGTLIFG